MKKTILLCSVAILASAMVSCVEEEGAGFLGMTVSAATNTCSGAAATNPLASIDRLQIQVTNFLVKQDGGETAGCVDETVQVADGIAELTAVKAGADRVVTVLGYEGNSTEPAWYGRARNVTVVEDRASDINLVLTRYNAFTCVSQQFGADVPDAEKQAQQFTHTVFPAAVRLGDGRVFLSGGLTAKTSLGQVDGLDTYDLNTPTTRAYIYDPATGVFEFAGNMKVARAGHAVAYVAINGRDSVVILGGTGKVRMQTGGNFPFTIDSSDSLDSIEIFDVKDRTFTLSTYEDGVTPKKMRLGRAFFNAGKMIDNSVLIAGGGQWPVDPNPDYRFAEIWAPYADDGRGGILELGDSMPLSTQRNGAAMIRLSETSRGLSRFILVGGTANREAPFEVFTQSSKQEEGIAGAFKIRVDRDFAALNSNTLMPKMYFPSIVQIADDPNDGVPHERFLIVYGAFESRDALQADAYKLGSKVQMGYELRIYDDVSSTNSADQKDGVRLVPLYGDCGRRSMGAMVTSNDEKSVVMFGGFAGNSGVSNLKTCTFDATRTSFGTGDAFSVLPTGVETFMSRGGFAAVQLPDDTIFIAGGIISQDTLDADGPGMTEVYTPAMLWTAESNPECGGAN